MRAVLAFTIVSTMALVAAACGDDAPSTTDTPGSPVEAGQPFAEDRCAANRDAGTITYLTSFGLAAAASIIDVVLADDAGYYEDLCLDVSVTPSFSTDNYPLVASGTAQMSSGGSFSEVAAFATNTGGDFTVIGVAGNTPIEVLLAEDARSLTELRGTTIGVQGVMPPVISAMLAKEGLVEGTDFETVPLAGYDPVANIDPAEISAITAYRSNEPGQLDAAGIPFTAFSPADFGIPGSFGVYYVSSQFAADHPTAVEDFMRATLRGLADALDDPEAAVATAIAAIEATGNPNFLTLEGETFRWTTEAELVAETALDPLAVPDAERLQAELDAYAPFGIFGDHDTPDAALMVDPGFVLAVHADGTLVWPADPTDG